ncbi:hypothetical protein CA830_01765 [Burkholderia multivorans]|nr:hypothetical protein CA830_01765 [Burkholderia multivorans]
MVTWEVHKIDYMHERSYLFITEFQSSREHAMDKYSDIKEWLKANVSGIYGVALKCKETYDSVFVDSMNSFIPENEYPPHYRVELQFRHDADAVQFKLELDEIRWRKEV